MDDSFNSVFFSVSLLTLSSVDFELLFLPFDRLDVLDELLLEILPLEWDRLLFRLCLRLFFSDLQRGVWRVNFKIFHK